MRDLEAVYADIERRVAFDPDDDDWSLDAAMGGLSEPERALWVTRFLERTLADGGWSLVLADAWGTLLEPAVRAYELLGLPDYAAHITRVLASRYDGSSDAESERLDEEFAVLSGAEEARAEFAVRSGQVE